MKLKELIERLELIKAHNKTDQFDVRIGVDQSHTSEIEDIIIDNSVVIIECED